MPYSIIARTVGTFLFAAIAAFLATDPNALPSVWKAALVAIMAGLAAVGIKPPWTENTAPVVVAPADDTIHDMLKQAVEENR